MEYTMKKVLLSILTTFLLLSAISLDVSAAKKSSKLSKEAITEMSDDIDKLTQKIYGRALLSPADNEILIGIKIKLDNHFKNKMFIFFSFYIYNLYVIHILYYIYM